MALAAFGFVVAPLAKPSTSAPVRPPPPSAPSTVKAPTVAEACAGDYLTMSSPSGPFQSGPAVAQMQDALRARGYPVDGDAKGVLGPATHKAMIDFQRAQQRDDPSFKVDGLAGPQTLGALGLAPPHRPSEPPSSGGAKAPMVGAPAPAGALKAGDLARADSGRIATTAPSANGTTMVPVERTKMTGSQAAEALSAAWTKKYGSPPSKETLSILTAQWAHETGRGNSMMNYNFGGIKGTSPAGLSASYKTKEGHGASEITITDRFRAYRTPEEGAADYLNLLDRRYSGALDAARAGDPAGFVRGLKAKGYFTGDETAYVNSVTALSRSAMTRGYDSIGAKVA